MTLNIFNQKSFSFSIGPKTARWLPFFLEAFSRHYKQRLSLQCSSDLLSKHFFLLPGMGSDIFSGNTKASTRLIYPAEALERVSSFVTIF